MPTSCLAAATAGTVRMGARISVEIDDEFIELLNPNDDTVVAAVRAPVHPRHRRAERGMAQAATAPRNVGSALSPLPCQDGAPSAS
jgi:hypothetical protein